MQEAVQLLTGTAVLVQRTFPLQRDGGNALLHDL